MRKAILLACLLLSACEDPHPIYPQFVMLNRQTRVTVECQQPDVTAAPADFLKSRACLSACEAHGFRPVPNMPAPPGEAEIPAPCSN